MKMHCMATNKPRIYSVLMYCNIGTVMSKMKFNGMQYSILGMCFFPVARLIYMRTSVKTEHKINILFSCHIYFPRQTNSKLIAHDQQPIVIGLIHLWALSI